MDKYIELLFEGESKQAQKLMRSMIPDKLYKFVPLTEDEVLNESKFDCVENNTFFFSTVKNINDPYEFKGIYLTEEELINIGWPESEAKRILSSYDPDAWFAIGCFTGNDERFLPMWAYYTNNYRGYCVEYNVDDPTQIFKVLYDAERSPGAPPQHESASEQSNTAAANIAVSFFVFMMPLSLVSNCVFIGLLFCL